MKNRLQVFCCVVGAIATFAGTSAIAAAQSIEKGWVAVMTDERERTWYVDSGTIEGKGQFRYFWSYTTGDTPYSDNGKMAYSTAFYLSVDCQQKKFRLRYAKSLDQNSQLIKEYNFGDSQPLGSPTSGSGEEASMNYVCRKR